MMNKVSNAHLGGLTYFYYFSTNFHREIIAPVSPKSLSEFVRAYTISEVLLHQDCQIVIILITLITDYSSWK